MEDRYLSLLRYEKELISSKKLFLEENMEEYLKLIEYEMSISDHLKWQQKHRYFLLITNFLDKKIDTNEYIYQLVEVQREFENLLEKMKLDFQKMKEFEPNPLSKGFCKLTGDLSSDCRF